MRRFAFVLLSCLSTHSLVAANLQVAPNGRHLAVDGQPFFWLGDTVWLLAQLPSREEIELYLRTRVEQRFTVIQLTAVMGEERVWGTKRATSRGDVPFHDANVLKPAVTPGNDPNDPQQYDYWDHLDYVLERIQAHGLRPALVTYFVGWQGDGYKFLTPDTAYSYGQFLGDRYRGKPEIIWVLGGDHVPKTDEHKAVWNLVAKGVAEGLTGKEDYSTTLMTYHISGGSSSSQFWHGSPWLDFNMAQTWSAYQDIYPTILRDYEKSPVKPCGLGEGAYEDGPQYPTKPIDALVIRKQACWSWFAGGYHTYGNGNVWHFDSLKAESTQPWKEALHSPGAATLRHARTFLESVKWWTLVPDQSLFAQGPGTGVNLNTTMRTQSTNAIAVFFCSPSPAILHLDKLNSGTKASAKWVNAATGQEQSGGDFLKQPQTFAPPSGWTDAFLHVVAGTD
jgi:hypothetical protein